MNIAQNLQAERFSRDISFFSLALLEHFRLGGCAEELHIDMEVPIELCSSCSLHVYVRTYDLTVDYPS